MGEGRKRQIREIYRQLGLPVVRIVRIRIGTLRATPNLPPRPKPVTPHGPTGWIEIKLREGKKRQIRHMTAAVGLFTLRLVRVAIGQIRLGELGVGEWRELTRREIASLRS